MYIVCQNTRADGSKGNSTANMFLEAYLQEFTYNEYVNYIKGSGLCVTYASYSSKKKTSNGHEVYTCNINLKHPKPELIKFGMRIF